MVAFDAIIHNEPKCLILGSMPGKVSLDKVEYYAHPRNSFWWLMSSFFEFDEAIDYQQKCQHLSRNKVALWDVLHDCERLGSLDSNIVTNTEVPNDFKTFLTDHSSIETIIFNGAAAERIFYRHNKKLLVDFKQNGRVITCYRCPSTSPAHASLTKYEKRVAWSVALNNLLP